MTGRSPAPDPAAWLAKNRAAWNERAAGWERMLEEDPARREAELRQAAGVLAIGPDTRLLDAGCGTGHWAVGFAQHGARVTAIDLAPAMLATAERRAFAAGVGLALREGDILSQVAADPDAAYDAIHCRCVLQFTPDLAAVLREFARVLRPGGRLLTAVPGSLSPIYGESYRRFLEPLANNRVVPWELEQLLEHLGWELLDGWGSYVTAGNGESNAFSEPAVLDLPLRLQQAAATFWVHVAQKRG